MASSSKSEQAYIRSSLLAEPCIRDDGRGLTDYRSIALETGVVPLANGSARLRIGGSALNGIGNALQGTEVLAAVKLEIENVGEDGGADGGRISCSVSCSPSAYPHHTSNALDELQADLTNIMNSTLSHPTLLSRDPHDPAKSALTIIPGRKSWLLNLDLVILSEGGNTYDALSMASFAALSDTRIPRTRTVEYRAVQTEDVTMAEAGTSGLDTRSKQLPKSTDFELLDYWDEGEPLGFGTSGSWPVCITLNILSPKYFLDATLMEESAVPLRLLLFYCFPPSDKQPHVLQGMRLLGHGEMNPQILKDSLQDASKAAEQLCAALSAKLRQEQNRRLQGKPRKKGNS